MLLKSALSFIQNIKRFDSELQFSPFGKVKVFQQTQVYLISRRQTQRTALEITDSGRCPCKSAAVQKRSAVVVRLWIAGHIDQRAIDANVKRIAALGAGNTVDLPAAENSFRSRRLSDFERDFLFYCLILNLLLDSPFQSFVWNSQN